MNYMIEFVLDTIREVISSFAFEYSGLKLSLILIPVISILGIVVYLTAT